ncbi:hypothetical protein ALC62_09169 [Cyphomyrmex costatus]|uniref:Uncharacterized protein n=1 Tax=Cyphomyrmex costatus TaxID=456900 RepID=A0A195CH92_9HYME|nr:hypothetical protein ALC62_09169 [Cyphomyrmex costatus]
MPTRFDKTSFTLDLHNAIWLQSGMKARRKYFHQATATLSVSVVFCKQFDSVTLTSQIFGVSPAKTEFALPNRLIFTRPKATVNIRGLRTENNANSVNIGKL